jgi:acetoin utilization deacetylase AcuC-like enzyme
MNTKIFYHPDFLKHQTPEGHPESKERLIRTLGFLEKKDVLLKIEMKEPTKASFDQIALAHDSDYIESVKKTALNGGAYLDGDTFISSGSYEAASFAAGAVISAVDLVVNTSSNAFCLVRPPGHHAVSCRGMGFCLFNNLAVGAKYAQQKYGIKRILIFDWDAHHGNGIQEIFYSDPSVLYISFHQSPLYPGTGSIHEVGKGDGEGFTINLPLPQHASDQTYLKLFSETVLPIGIAFNPEIIMVAAGYDSHYLDPLASLGLDVYAFEKMTEELKKFSNNKLIISLEGGYNLDVLPKCIFSTISALSGMIPEVEEETLVFQKDFSEQEALGIFEEAKKIYRNYWKI